MYFVTFNGYNCIIFFSLHLSQQNYIFVFKRSSEKAIEIDFEATQKQCILYKFTIIKGFFFFEKKKIFFGQKQQRKILNQKKSLNELDSTLF